MGDQGPWASCSKLLLATCLHSTWGLVKLPTSRLLSDQGRETTWEVVTPNWADLVWLRCNPQMPLIYKLKMTSRYYTHGGLQQEQRSRGLSWKDPGIFVQSIET